ncbi:MAG TPA: hypothetical protein VIR81_06245 [Myxococcales bacterium]
MAERQPQLAIARLTRALAGRVADVPQRFQAQLLLARALAATGRAQEAGSRRRALAAEAKAKGFALVESAAARGP